MSGGGNPSKQAAVLEGDNIIMFGLAADYVLQDSVPIPWSGNHGQLYFFQSRLVIVMLLVPLACLR